MNTNCFTTLSDTIAIASGAAAQDQRRRALAGLIRQALLPSIHREGAVVRVDLGEHGNWNPQSQTATGDMRLVLWIARAFLLGAPDDCHLANELLESWSMTSACHFCGVAAMSLLLTCKPHLSATSIDNLESFVLRYLSDWMTDDYRFVGANDNAPIECLAILALAGQHFERPALIEFARERLRQLDHVLDLRGYIHEANSPTYSGGVSLPTLAELAELSHDAELKRMALRAEERIWQEVLLHFHPTIKHQLGPFSRGYPDDNANQCTMTIIALWCALGEISPFNPLSMLCPPPAGTFTHNSWLFHWCAASAISAPTYHPPVELTQACLQRKLPFSSLGSHEFISTSMTPFGASSVSTYMTEEYGLSSFGSRLLGGATVPVQALYRRHFVAADRPVEAHLEAVRSLYTRCYVSQSFDTGYQRDDAAAHAQIDHDNGAAFTVQHKNTLLLGYVPVTSDRTHGVHDLGPVRTVRASVVLPLHHSRPDEVWHGDRQLAGFSGSFGNEEWAFIRDGDIYIALHPLLAKQDEAMLCTQQYSDCGTYGFVSCYNMCRFTAEPIEATALRSLGSGFVVEMSCRAEAGSFEAFREKMLTARIDQRQWSTRREIRYRREGVDLELNYDWWQLNLQRAAVNGKLVSNTVKLATEPAMQIID